MLSKGGNISLEELNKLANQIVSETIDESGTGKDIKVLDHIESIKTSFLRWKNANLQKFQQLQDIEHKDVEMLLDKIHMLQRNIK